MGWMSLVENGKEIGLVGDEPWDIMGKAIEKIIEVYAREIGRKPTEAELISIFEFCYYSELERSEEG